MSTTLTLGGWAWPLRRVAGPALSVLTRWLPVFALGSACAYALLTIAMRVAYISIGNDDGYYATVSRNVAEGRGYVTTYGETLRTFNPEVSAGPALILPSALMQVVLGSHYWVANMVVPVIALPLVAAIGWLLNRRFGVSPVGLSILALASIAFTDERNYDGDIVRQMGLWAHQMGDIPAVLFVVLAALLLTMGERRPAVFAGAGVMLALAFYTRVTAALALPGFAFYVAWMLRAGRDIRPMGALLGGAIAVAIPFELYRMAELGSVSAYIANTWDFVDFYRTWGFTGSDHDLESLLRQMGLGSGIVALLAWAAVLGYDWSRRGPLDGHERRAVGLAVLLLTAGTVTIAWWVLISESGWYRHAIPGVMYVAVALTVIASHVRLPVTRWATAGAVLVLFLTQWPAVVERMPPSSPEPRLEAQLATRDALNGLVAEDVSLWGCGWWGNRDLAYVGDFRFYDCADAASVWKHLDNGERLVLVRSEYWNWERDPAFDALASHCDRRMIFQQWPFFVCDATEWLRSNTPRPG
jgi:hypothetical protein